MTDHNIDITGRTVVGEARGDGQPGMELVASVVMNRAQIASHYVELHGRHHPLFGDGSLASACQANFHGIYQFSCWNQNDPNRAIIENLNEGMEIFRVGLVVATSAVNGTLRDRTNGATHYRRIGTPAAWANGKTPCFTEGHHEFFNDIS
jgi:hypothetical protein